WRFGLTLDCPRVSGAFIAPKVSGRAQMADRTPDRVQSSCLSIKTTLQLMATAAAAIGLWFGSPTASSFPQGGQAGSTEGEEGPAEWLAKPEELASIPIDRIMKSLRLNGIAMKLGREVYENECASCHGDDLKGRRDRHTPDLTDADWRFSGDDL